ncbi:major facilitator superfamily domain-containing protein [Cantharellus anzutake]|uniref:major facilitator superfamily domain-containing protein n=1 Tax=Cantharellus anzutake TaxID=1750568 RepID=UPI001907ECCF|nr:major facilitator superfamily domain-containing protein [Cantharellus anzutake]KAF8321442.1 major facilitator superfamily domain-containing protein [Cantharellus anzutake]
MERITFYYCAATLWALLSPFQYGYHTSALNQIQSTLTCHPPESISVPSSIPSCVPISDALFGVITAFFTLGGLLGSLSANLIMDCLGRRGALLVNAFIIAIGSTIFAISGGATGFIIARLIIGFGAGIGLCALPIYLAETAPPRIRNRVGVLNQLFITFGILGTQSIGLPLAKMSLWHWRLVLIVSAILAIVQCFAVVFISDTPAWLAAKGRDIQAVEVSRKLWGPNYVEPGPSPTPPASSSSTPHWSRNSSRTRDDSARILRDDAEQQGLLSEDEADGGGVPRHDPRETSSTIGPTEPITVLELLKRKELRRPVAIVALSMIAQQGSGINAVIYYSTSILGKALPTDAAIISLLISIMNVLCTVIPVIVIGFYSPRDLLLISTWGSVLSIMALGYGLNANLISLSSVAICIFVGGFAFGLGPVPFMLPAELVPYYASSALASFGLSLNWIANFLIGVAFLPLKDWLAGRSSSGDTDAESGQGNVFFIFSAALVFCGVQIRRLYR